MIIIKIGDLEVADVTRSESIRKLKFHQKYLLLELGEEVYELEISDVSDTAFYLKIKEDFMNDV